MVKDKQIHIEVAYTQRIIKLDVPENCTVQLAIDRSGILLEFPDIDLMHQKVGIFSKQKNLHDKVSEGDRVEIYRPLLIDPKEARKKRVQKTPPGEV